MNAKFFEEQRREMVAAISEIAEHIAAELGETAFDERVLRAMAKVPRHEFVPIEVQSYAYLNRPIPIGFDKTISQPLMVAVMTDLLELKSDDLVLEIGTGLGYQSAVLAELSGVHFEGAGFGCFAGFGLRKSGGHGGVKGDAAFHFLHRLI